MVCSGILAITKPESIHKLVNSVDCLSVLSKELFLKRGKIVVFFSKWVYNQGMRPIIDTHTHTIASGHWTTDTATDLARAAAARK